MSSDGRCADLAAGLVGTRGGQSDAACSSGSLVGEQPVRRNCLCFLYCCLKSHIDKFGTEMCTFVEDRVFISGVTFPFEAALHVIGPSEGCRLSGLPACRSCHGGCSSSALPPELSLCLPLVF